MLALVGRGHAAVLPYVAQELREDAEVVERAVGGDPAMWRFVGERLGREVGFVERCVRKNPGVFLFLAQEMREMESVRRSAEEGLREREEGAEERRVFGPRREKGTWQESNGEEF